MPLVPVYAAVIETKRWLWDRGVLPQRRLAHPVISVGSISAGGAGKTPVVTMLGRLLQQRGFEVRVLTRGYRRHGVAILRVDAKGDAQEFGDEPLMMARRVKDAAVWVGINRHRAGRMSERCDLPGAKVVYLLDDGLQHRKLARDVDIVLLTRQDIEDSLLPAGNLREPLKAIRRADIVVVREDETSLSGVVGTRPVWVIRRRLVFPQGMAIPQRPVVFCGLARPEGFLGMLSAKGVVPAAVVKFRDHHPYAARDVDRLVANARAANADGFLTTEKDVVKLTAAMMKRLKEIGSVTVVELQVELDDEQTRINGLLTMLDASVKSCKPWREKLVT